MFNFIAVEMEIFSIIIFSMLVYVKKIRSTNIVICVCLSLIYAFMNQIISTIPVFIHYIILTLLLIVLHREESIKIAPFASLVSYAGLIYFQVICLRFFSAEWLEAHYDLAGLIINVIILVIAILLYVLFSKLHVDIQFNHLRVWQVVFASFIAISVLLFCYIYKPILEAKYYIATDIWMGFVGAILLAVLVLERQSDKVKNKRIIRALKEKLTWEYEYNHDMAKELKVMQYANSDFIEEFQQEYNFKLCLERLPHIVQGIMRAYFQTCMEKQIDLQLEVPEPVLDWPATSKDTICILGNLLENAVEAVENLPLEERYIRIAMDQSDNMWTRITVCNSCLESSALKEETLFQRGVSTKQGEGRGYGLFLISKKAKKYHGEVRMEMEKGLCVICVDLLKSK